MSRRLSFPVHQDIASVVVSEHPVPVGLVPSIEVEIVHALEVALNLILNHESPIPDQQWQARAPWLWAEVRAVMLAIYPRTA